MTPQQHEIKTARELQWPAVIERIAQRCHSEVAAEAMRSLRPEGSLKGAQERMQRTAEAMRLHSEAPLPAARVDDQAEALSRLAHGIPLDAQELWTLGTTLDLADKLRHYMARHGSDAPALSEWLRVPDGLDVLGALIARCIGPDGALLDDASPALRRARRSATDLRDDLRQRLSKLMGRLGEAMQGAYVAEREGRYVLPVRADAPFRVDGVVFGSSASGGTLYVEPRETHDLGNRVQRAEAEVRAEEAKVLRELNTAAQQNLDSVVTAQQACVHADCLRALSLYAAQDRAIAIHPHAESHLMLRAMRHPLLINDEQPVVANDLSLSGGQALVLSGPNAGGKTVGLKCLGLAAWMVRCGIPIAADEGSTVGWFGSVMTEIGDNQSLMHSLSTFSAHITHVSACIDRASDASLVLVDEPSGGTDPDEGAALACALVEALLERGAAVCVTTHYERLKSIAAADPRMQNAAVGFDRERLRPTFQIEYGAPGASAAFLVAHRHGVDRAIIERAEQLLPDALVDNRALALELDAQRERFQSATLELEADKRTVSELKLQLESERRQAENRQQAHLSRETQSLLEEVRSARSRLRDAEAQLARSGRSTDALKLAQRAANEVAQFVAIGGRLTRAASGPATSPPPVAATLSWDGLAVGARVTLVELGTTGEVVAKPKRGKVTVAVGAMKTTVDLNALRLVAGGNKAKPKSAPGRAARSVTRPQDGSLRDVPRTEDNTCKLIGQRVDDALSALDGFIDRLLQTGEPAGYVLHGHGTGALKKAVRQHLRSHGLVSRAAPAEQEDGGDAFTVLWLG